MLIQQWIFDKVQMTLTLKGMGEVKVQLVGFHDGGLLDCVIAWPNGVKKPEDMAMISGAIRGKESDARALCDSLLEAVSS